MIERTQLGSAARAGVRAKDILIAVVEVVERCSMSSSGIAAEEQGRIGSLDTKTTVTYQEEHCCLYPVFDSVDVVHLLDRRPFSLLVFDAVVKYVDDNTG